MILTPSQRFHAVRNVSVGVSVRITDSPAATVPYVPRSTAPGASALSLKLHPVRSTGALPTLVNSMNSPLVPEYMYSVMRMTPARTGHAVNGTVARVLLPGLPMSPPADAIDASPSPTAESVQSVITLAP